MATTKRAEPSTGNRGGRCKTCGCDAAHACVDADLIPCEWITPVLCSYCAWNVPAFKPGMKLYESRQFEESRSYAVRWLVMGHQLGSPCIESERADGLVLRPDLVTDVGGDYVEIAASILADCFQSDALAIELGAVFAMNVIRHLMQESVWAVNEFQVREWVAENKVPY